MRIPFLQHWKREEIEMLLWFKVGLTATFFAIYFLPPTAAAFISAASNTFWLWKVK